MSLDPLQDPFTRRHYLPNTMNFHGTWSAATQYYKFDVVVCPTALSSYILTGRSALIGGLDPSLNPDWEELSAAATGVLSLTTGAGITNTNTATNPNLVNSGVLSVAVAPGPGIATSAATGALTLTNTGIISLAAANPGIVIGGGSAATIANNGILAITAGAGLASSGATNAPILASTRTLKKFNLPGSGTFIGPGNYTGSAAYTIGNFTIPADAVPGSTALLYSAGYSANSWAPLLPGNVMDFRFGFSATSATTIASWYSPAVGGFLVQPFNANNVPQPLPVLPHTAGNIANPDYTNLPATIVLDNITPGQIIYANVEVPYGGDTVAGVGIYAPLLVYLAQ